MLPAGTSFALSGGVGYFEDQGAGTMAISARIGENAAFSAAEYTYWGLANAKRISSNLGILQVVFVCQCLFSYAPPRRRCNRDVPSLCGPVVDRFQVVAPEKPGLAY